MPTRGGRAKRPREATDSRRVTHNQSEQRRAKRINTHIDDIKTMLQSCGYLGERTDKGTILENAARFISDHVDSAPGGGGAGAAIGAMRDAPSGTSGIDYVQVFQQSGVAQAIAGMDGSFVDCNRRFSELSGFTRDEVQRRSIFNMTPAEDLQHTFEIVSELMGPTSSSMGKPVEVRQFSKPCKMRGGIVAVDRARADRIRRAAAVASSAPGAPMSSMSSAAQAAILHDDAMRAAGFADDRSLLERSQEAEPGHDPRSVTQAELGSLSRPGYRRHGVPDESALSGLHMPALNGPASARARAYSASGMSDPIADHHHAMDGAGGLSLLSAASIHHEADMAGRGGQSSAMGAGRLPTGFTASSGQPAQGSAGGALSHGMIGAGALSVNSQSQNGNGMLGAGALSVLSDAPQAFLGDSRGDLSLVSDAVGDGLHEDAEGDGAGPNGRYSTSSSQLHH
ncbi:hypothetical protein FNF28_03159 [Cafeteria roenbergensis]|uniref:BHLH domain-containing protein n=1 Tax=Cafeteria roenbergensis TaxID=33653 RepID=A0A5A8DRB6_CAFRO|nr:hypothetical protein FNF28_03159 [Cafeteria roenbergensis]